MSDRRPIYQQGQDFFVPQFRIVLNDRDLGEEVVHDILRVTYKDNIKEIDSFEITINNWDEEFPSFSDARTRWFKYSDYELFDPGAKVDISMGYFGKDRMKLMTRGEITSLKPTFPASGGSTLAISGLNVLHRLRTKQESDRYERLKDSQIAQRVSRRMRGQQNVRIRTDPDAVAEEDVNDYVLQDNQYDIVFLMERAMRIGYDLVVQEDGGQSGGSQTVLYFGPSTRVRQEPYELVYGESLIQFSPTLTTANQVGKVTVRSWHRTRKRELTGTATRAELATRGVGQRGRQAALERAFGDREEVITDRPVESNAHAKRLAREILESISKDMVKGSGSTVGLPDLRAGTIVYICGLGDRFSGRYSVTSTTHTIDDSGYKTQFECRREEIEDE